MLNFTAYVSLYALSKFRLHLALKSRLPMLDLLLSSLFALGAACVSARANSLTKREKIVAWLVTNLTKPSRAGSS
jgi:hypothetical protein